MCFFYLRFVAMCSVGCFHSLSSSSRPLLVRATYMLATVFSCVSLNGLTSVSSKAFICESSHMLDLCILKLFGLKAVMENTFDKVESTSRCHTSACTSFLAIRTRNLEPGASCMNELNSCACHLAWWLAQDLSSLAQLRPSQRM